MDVTEVIKPEILRISNAQVICGESTAAILALIRQEPDLDYLTLNYLSESTLPLLAIQQKKEHSTLCLENVKDSSFCHLETKESLTKIEEKVVTVNTYLGAKPIVNALLAGADIVITGCMTISSLTVAPCVACFGWTWDEYDKIAGAVVAGHLIECGTQVTGGGVTNWLDVPDVVNIGLPIVEIDSEGFCVVTKSKGSGGVVNEESVKEQLLYKIEDPAKYLNPDATVSFLSLSICQAGENRVRVWGATALPPPLAYKAKAIYRADFKSEALLPIFGREVEKKAKLCGKIILQRVYKAGYDLQRVNIECLGIGSIVPGVITKEIDLSQPAECVLRMSVADERKEALECFVEEIFSLVANGPQGITGCLFGRPKIRQLFGVWPCSVPRGFVAPTMQVMEAKS